MIWSWGFCPCPAPARWQPQHFWSLRKQIAKKKVPSNKFTSLNMCLPPGQSMNRKRRKDHFGWLSTFHVNNILLQLGIEWGIPTKLYHIKGIWGFLFESDKNKFSKIVHWIIFLFYFLMKYFLIFKKDIWEIHFAAQFFKGKQLNLYHPWLSQGNIANIGILGNCMTRSPNLTLRADSEPRPVLETPMRIWPSQIRL